MPFLFLQIRALDVDVDNANTGRASLVAIAKAAGVKSPLVTYEQVCCLFNVWTWGICSSVL